MKTVICHVTVLTKEFRKICECLLQPMKIAEYRLTFSDQGGILLQSCLLDFGTAEWLHCVSLFFLLLNSWQMFKDYCSLFKMQQTFVLLLPNLGYTRVIIITQAQYTQKYSDNHSIIIIAMGPYPAQTRILDCLFL